MTARKALYDALTPPWEEMSNDDYEAVKKFYTDLIRSGPNQPSRIDLLFMRITRPKIATLGHPPRAQVENWTADNHARILKDLVAKEIDSIEITWTVDWE